MFRYFLYFWLGLLLIAKSYAEPDFTIAKLSSKMTAYYHIHQQDMHFENKAYRLFIAEPKQQSKPLPVLYLLDGNAHFPLAVNAVNPDLPLPLIVGIGYVSDNAYSINERRRDYTFSVQDETFKNGGGAADFLRFIQTEVKPYIEQHYRIHNKKQHFFGHSFGGLFGLYILFHQPHLFQYYTLASPSLWWGTGEFLPKKSNWIAHKPEHILITLGEYEEFPEKDPQITPEQKQRIQQRQQIRPFNAEQLSEKLKSQGNNAHFLWILNKNHGDSIPEAIKYSVELIQK